MNHLQLCLLSHVAALRFRVISLVLRSFLDRCAGDFLQEFFAVDSHVAGWAEDVRTTLVWAQAAHGSSIIGKNSFFRSGLRMLPATLTGSEIS